MDFNKIIFNKIIKDVLDMDKRDCALGMFVNVIQNTSSVSHSRLKTKRIGEIIGIYDTYVNLLLYDAFDAFDDLTINKKLYRESFRFSEISSIDKRGV